MPLASVLGCGTSRYLIKEQLYIRGWLHAGAFATFICRLGARAQLRQYMRCFPVVVFVFSSVLLYFFAVLVKNIQVGDNLIGWR
jgi:hypothetical protein